MKILIGVIVAAIVVWAALGTVGLGLLALALLALVLTYHAAKWAFWPRTHLARNRVRHQRIRLYLYLHPGRGHATWWELHRHWSRRASYKRAAQVRSS